METMKLMQNNHYEGHNHNYKEDACQKEEQVRAIAAEPEGEMENLLTQKLSRC